MFLNRPIYGKKPIGIWDDLEAPARIKARAFSFGRMTLIELVVVVMIIGVLIALLLPSGDWDFSHRYPPAGPITLPGDHAIAGEYFQRYGRGSRRSLSILPDGRYSFYWAGCCGIYNRESGYINRVDGTLVMAPIKPIERRMDRTFVPIKWGQRSYLIATGQLEGFCDAIIRGDEPRVQPRGLYYVSGEIVQVDGIPEMPEPWATYLREKMLVGTIVEVKKGRRARIDLGSADGLRVGSSVTVQGREEFSSRSLSVVAVDSHSSEGEEVNPVEFNRPLAPGREVVWAREVKAPENP